MAGELRADRVPTGLRHRRGAGGVVGPAPERRGADGAEASDQPDPRAAGGHSPKVPAAPIGYWAMRRIQVHLDHRQDTLLARQAAARGVTKSTLIREAIDRYLDRENERNLRALRFRAAVDEVAGIAP